MRRGITGARICFSGVTLHTRGDGFLHLLLLLLRWRGTSEAAGGTHVKPGNGSKRFTVSFTPSRAGLASLCCPQPSPASSLITDDDTAPGSVTFRRYDDAGFGRNQETLPVLLPLASCSTEYPVVGALVVVVVVGSSR